MSDLRVNFDDIFAKVHQGDYSSFSPTELSSLITKTDLCINLVASEALFSKNEELDAIATESLKVRDI